MWKQIREYKKQKNKHKDKFQKHRNFYFTF